MVCLYGAINAREGGGGARRAHYGMDFETTFKVANDPVAPVRQRRRLVTRNWEPTWYDLRLTRLKTAPKDQAERERSGLKLEYARGEELVAAYEGGPHQNNCKRVKIVVPV